MSTTRHNMIISHTVRSEVVYGICFDDVAGTNKESIAKRKQRLKSLLKDHYGESVSIIGTGSNHLEVIVNSNNLNAEVTLNSNQEDMIKKECSKILKT